MILSKSNKLFNKLMSTNRRGHILKILDTFDKEHIDYGKNTPLDLHIRTYYLKNKKINVIDREFINDQVYNLVRHKGLLDFLTKSPISWEGRFESF